MILVGSSRLGIFYETRNRGIPKTSRADSILMRCFREEIPYWHVFFKLRLAAIQRYLAS